MDSSRNRSNRARQRHEDRLKHRDMVTLATDTPVESVPTTPASQASRILPKIQDLFWYLRHHTPVVQAGGVIIAIVVVLFFMSLFFSPQIGANVWALGVPLAGKSVDEAKVALREAWANSIQIDVTLNGQVLRQVTPSELGLQLNADEMAQQAKAVGLQGFPLGYDIQPIVSNDYGATQTLLLDLVDAVYIPTFEAGFEWQGDQLISVPGRGSRELDIMLTLEYVTQNPVGIIKSRHLDLITKTTPPIVVDSSLYLDQAKTFLSQNFRLIGYDPFIDQSLPWTSTRDEIAKWVAVGANGLVVREGAFKQFLEAVNGQLRAEAQPRYLDPQEAIGQLGQAMLAGTDTAYLRIRYMPTTMELADGDWGQRISRRTGIPFRLIEDVNPGIDWNALSVGDVINLPTRDLLLPETPIPTKRIVVDLDRRYLVAFENDQIVMSWRVSIGQTEAPTYPGIFQVLTHNEKAYGSGFSLCGDTGCSQWEMEWFMGIYEVIPGLMNGFHGAVLLPNGAYLDDGQVGNASTFGCVMANNEQSKQLYDWAEAGTVVEIVSSEFPPESDLGKMAMEYISKTYQS